LENLSGERRFLLLETAALSNREAMIALTCNITETCCQSDANALILSDQKSVRRHLTAIIHEAPVLARGAMFEGPLLLDAHR